MSWKLIFFFFFNKILKFNLTNETIGNNTFTGIYTKIRENKKWKTGATLQPADFDVNDNLRLPMSSGPTSCRRNLEIAEFNKFRRNISEGESRSLHRVLVVTNNRSSHPRNFFIFETIEKLNPNQVWLVFH